MTGGEPYKTKLLTDDALDAAISAYLADLSKPVTVEAGKGSIDVAAAVSRTLTAPRGWLAGA